VQVAEAVDGVGGALGKRRVLLVHPALVLQPRDRIGDRDRALELLERAIDQGAMRPRARMRDVEVIAVRLGRKPRRAVRRDAVAKAAVDALELARLSGLLRQLLVAPDAVDQHAHVPFSLSVQCLNTYWASSRAQADDDGILSGDVLPPSPEYAVALQIDHL